jgi:hypothetical protein
MADDFTVTVSGEREIEIEFDHTIPDAVHRRLYGAIEEITERLYAAVEGDAPRRTGRLASEIHPFVEDDPHRQRITGGVGMSDEYAKAGALEYGAPGSRNRNSVEEHMRRQTVVFGHRLDAPRLVLVKALTRHLNVIERRFLRSPLERMAPDIQKELQDAVNEAAEEVNND